MENKGILEASMRVSNLINGILLRGARTGIDDQIKAIETVKDNLLDAPVFHAVISSLEELRGIKASQVPKGKK